MRNRKIRSGPGRRTAALFCAAVLLLSLFVPPISATADGSKVVRVGYMLLEHFEEGGRGEIKSGYGYEYLQMIRNYTGWTYEYVYGTAEELLDMLTRGEIDLLSHVARIPKRDETMLFSLEPQGVESHYLFTCRTETELAANNLQMLNGKSVGMIQGDFRKYLFADWCREEGIDCTIVEYKTKEQMHEDLHNGKLIAVSCSRQSIADYPGEWRSIIRFDDAPVFFAVNKDRPDLLDAINAAQAQILALNAYYGEELQQKYLAASTEVKPALTADEIARLEARGTLRVGYCDDRRPLAYTNDSGKLSGLLADYLTAMTDTFGITFETFAYADGIALLGALKNGDVDIIAPVGYNYGMAENSGVSVTDPITVEAMLAVFKGYAGTEKKDIYQRIAVLQNSVTEKDYAKRFYPDSVLVEADSIGEAIRFVENGVADCYMIRSSTYAWYKGEYPLLAELQFANLPNSNPVNMAIRTADIDLIPILNKGINLLDEADITSAIVAHSDARDEMNWLTLMMDNPFTTAVAVLAIVLTFVLIFVIYRLQTEKKYLQRLELARHEAEAARLQAENASHAKSTFLTSMSHDIRTPMNAIIGMTTLASKHLHNPDYVRNCLGKVTLASDHLLTLINDVLDINKIETGKLSLNPTVFSLADSIMNLTNIGRHQLKEKEHHFDIRVHNVKQEYLFADELRINQVFINLLSNAVKYTPAGGRITVDVAEEPIPGEPGKVRLIYTVADNGIGMTEEFQTHMYELFAMANRSNTTVTGSGVGLAICRQLIDLMDGRIDCVSAPGKGTTFTVTLDLPVADHVVDELILPPMKLLLVDDDEIFRTTASETLRELGLSPDCVDSGEKAIVIVTQKHEEGKDYPLIIIDWQMPGMDGIETTRAIRQRVGDDVSIIVISAYAPEEIGEAAIAAGANGFINKPFFRTHVHQSISRILGLYTDHIDSITEKHDRVRGMHLLVAEDNDLNWELARELLGMYEITAVRAENGRQCLELLEQAEAGTYDGILMDIQMPIMNGYDATRLIRDHARADLRTLPVVAMTADAYTEDVLHCAEAGMNAHIAKPIDMEKLLDVLGEMRDS